MLLSYLAITICEVVGLRNRNSTNLSLSSFAQHEIWSTLGHMDISLELHSCSSSSSSAWASPSERYTSSSPSSSSSAHCVDPPHVAIVLALGILKVMLKYNKSEIKSYRAKTLHHIKINIKYFPNEYLVLLFRNCENSKWHLKNKYINILPFGGFIYY